MNRPIQDVILILASFVIAISVHEFMHAWTAWKLGDTTAQRQGRITLNPVAHFDPFGFFGMLMISLGYPFIGWGKPVPVQPGNFTGRWRQNRKHGMLLVTAAGPLSNAAMALLAAIPYQIILRQGIEAGTFGVFIAWFIEVNVLLAAFNMIPVPPLDGYRILTAILPDFWGRLLRPLETYGFLILIMILFIGGQAGSSIISGMTAPVRNLLYQIVYTGLG